jgi:hypothetical protein
MLAERDRDLEEFQALIERLALGGYERSLIYSGLRGVGKTVLLMELDVLASEAGWATTEIQLKLDVQAASGIADSGDPEQDLTDLHRVPGGQPRRPAGGDGGGRGDTHASSFVQPSWRRSPHEALPESEH